MSFDVNPDSSSHWSWRKIENGDRSRIRVVVGTDGFAYLTTNHYRSFSRLTINLDLPVEIEFD